MDYKITEQYARGEEKPIAACHELEDAKHFIQKKSSTDDDHRKQVIYRLYDSEGLLHESNTQNIAVTHTTYDIECISCFMFQVMTNTVNSLERKTIAECNDIHDAYLFIRNRLENIDASDNSDLFFIMTQSMLIETINKTIMDERTNNASGSASNDKDSSYQLSPLSMRPTPSGGPPDYWVKKEENDDDQP